MLTAYLNRLMAQESLDSEESQALMKVLLSSAQPIQVAAVLALMRAKGETATELSAFVNIMRTHQIAIDVTLPLCDIVGTGGDGAATANISTMAAIVSAACGVKILKHGNRAVSSRCGSADVLEALGMRIEQEPHEVETSLIKHGFGFCYAPRFHPAFQSLKAIRQQLKIPTFFNLIGPLLNPGTAKTMLLGVSAQAYLPIMADCLINLGIERAMVVHGQGLDELNTLGPCEVIELNHGDKQQYTLDPKDLSLPRCSLQDLAGGNAHYNANLMKQVLSGEASHLADTVVLNAGAAVYLSGHASSVSEGITRARDVIHSGKAQDLLKELCHA